MNRRDIVRSLVALPGGILAFATGAKANELSKMDSNFTVTPLHTFPSGITAMNVYQDKLLVATEDGTAYTCENLP